MKIIIPDYYNGKLLKEDTSDFLKNRLLSYIEKLKSINEFLVPAILYIAAWRNDDKNNDIWYEYVGENFQEIFDTDIKDLPGVFRNSVIDRKIYTKNEDQVKIHTQHKDFFLSKKTAIRSELEYSGFNEAVYKINARGNILWLKDQAVVIPFEKDKITISIGNLTNVTKEMEAEEARRHAELALLKKEKMLRSLFNQAYDPIIITDLKGNILDCNEVSEIKFGHKREDIIGNSCWSFVTAEEEDKVKELIKNLCNKKSIRVETFLLRNDGLAVPTEISAVKIENDPPVIQAFIRDISEKKKLENERIKRSKFELVSTMASGIAHDINNILSIILGNLSLAAIENSKPEKNNISNILTRIEKASRHLETLTKKFFKFSEATSGVKTNLDINSFFKPIIENFTDNCEINLIIDNEIEFISINPIMMETVIKSVLTNSAEAMEDQDKKKIDIYIKKDNISDKDQTISTILKEGEYLNITITDNGSGIPNDYIDRVFDPYFSSKPLTSKKGTGLGLTNAYSVIKQHNGHIQIVSDCKTGTSAIIHLPV